MAVGFDKDGCIEGSPWSYDNLPSPILAERRLYQPVLELIRSLDDDAVIISNQKGIMRGWRSAPGVIAEMRWLMNLAPIKRAYFCPDRGDSCYWCSPTQWGVVNQISHPGWNFRKPSPGMAHLAAEQGFPVLVYYGDMSGTHEYGYGGAG